MLWSDPRFEVHYSFGVEDRIMADPTQDSWEAQRSGQVVIDQEFDMAKHQMALA